MSSENKTDDMDFHDLRDEINDTASSFNCGTKTKIIIYVAVIVICGLVLGRMPVAVIFAITIAYFFYINRSNWKLSETSQSNAPSSNTTRGYRPTGNVMGIGDLSSGPGYPSNGGGGRGGFF